MLIWFIHQSHRRGHHRHRQHCHRRLRHRLHPRGQRALHLAQLLDSRAFLQPVPNQLPSLTLFLVSFTKLEPSRLLSLLWRHRTYLGQVQPRYGRVYACWKCHKCGRWSLCAHRVPHESEQSTCQQSFRKLLYLHQGWEDEYELKHGELFPGWLGKKWCNRGAHHVQIRLLWRW